MSASLYVAKTSPVHKITFSEEFYSSLTIKSSLSPYGYNGCLKKSKSKVKSKPFIKRLFDQFFLVVTVSVVSSAFFTPRRVVKPLAD